jgi:Mannosylglycerate hydrolase MGH1-like glycoside hydrolase domain
MHNQDHFPQWGPYSKTFAGISHVSDKNKGIRFDLSVFPGVFRRKINLPSVLWECDYHPWKATPDLSYFSYRHEIEWKDKVYADISFERPHSVNKQHESARFINSCIVNNSEATQNITLHLVANLNFKYITNRKNALRLDPVEVSLDPVEIILPENSIWINGLDYTDICLINPGPGDNLVPDARLKGQVTANGYVNNTALGDSFGKTPGDNVSYSFAVTDKSINALLIRYMNSASSDTTSVLKINITCCRNLICSEVIKLPQSIDVQHLTTMLPALAPGDYQLTLECVTPCTLEIDGLLLCPADNIKKFQVTTTKWNDTPLIEKTDNNKSVILKYESLDHYYGISVLSSNIHTREYITDHLDETMRYFTHEHVLPAIQKNGDKHYYNIMIDGITLKPGEKQILSALVCCGSKSEVETRLSDFQKTKQQQAMVVSSFFEKNSNPSGDKYRFGVEKMAAQLLHNIVFPVPYRNTNICHFTPGKWWDWLYTWDAGFTGLGMAYISTEFSKVILETYLTEPGDKHSAFIQHGSFVPTQAYQFMELYQINPDTNYLGQIYPSLMQYYLFYIGHLEESGTDYFNSGLLRPWDYFYNSGGWDDYPPQVHVHKKNLTGTITPVANTAHAIRFAKFLLLLTAVLEENKISLPRELYKLRTDITDFNSYDYPQMTKLLKNDIARLSDALLRYSWNDASGFFSYVIHNNAGDAVDRLMFGENEDYNRGLDGLSPLFCGSLPEQISSQLIDTIADKDRFFTEIGLSTVDRQASYFNPEGYWNGAVWMPHQWFFFKALLDYGKTDLAVEIAETALLIWENEVRESYNCHEFFHIKSKRGAGWHQFSGLSSPVVNWFCALFQQGTITGGFDLLITKKHFDNKNGELNFDYTKLSSDIKSKILICLPQESVYCCTVNDKQYACKQHKPGLWEMVIPLEYNSAKVRFYSNEQ